MTNDLPDTDDLDEEMTDEDGVWVLAMIGLLSICVGVGLLWGLPVALICFGCGLLVVAAIYMVICLVAVRIFPSESTKQKKDD